MRTLDFKIWLLSLFLCTAPVTTMVAINVNRTAGYTAFMNKDKEIYYLYQTDGWQDGDVAEATEILPSLDIDNCCGVITNMEKGGYIWQYDNAGHFTSVSYPWWYTGHKPSTVNTIVVR